MSPAGGLEWRKLNAHRRLLVALVVAVAVALLAPGEAGVPVRLTGSWDAGVMVFLALTWLLVRRCPPDEVQRTVLANDQGRVAVLVLVLLATAASFSAIFFLLRQAKALASWALVLHIGLAVATIVCSWLMTHVMFALHYAHRFYRDDPRTPDEDATGGLQFPGTCHPHYSDFIYFSFVIGMTSQVSDVQVTSRPMRLLVFWHSLLSFAFYTIILAMGINIVAGII